MPNPSTNNIPTLPNNTLLQGGKYRIVRFISAGGFGCTYEAENTMFEERVAIKEFFVKDFCNRDELTHSISVGTQSKQKLVEKLRSKFIAEAKAIYKMQHPNIVSVKDIFEENGTAYYVMEFLEGQSLADLLKRKGVLPEPQAVEYIKSAAKALEYVHSKNRLHLDIKPGNIMLTSDGNVKLIDFGASKQYDEVSGENTSTLMGVVTPGYAPAEQSTRSFTNFSPSTDIYSLGATLYKLLTGITPPESVALMTESETLSPLPSTISAPTRDAVLQSMKHNRKERPQSIAEFLSLLNVEEEIEVTAEDTVVPENTIIEPAKIKQEPKPEKAQEPRQTTDLKSNKIFLTAVVVFFLVVSIGLVMGYIQREKSPSYDEVFNTETSINYDEGIDIENMEPEDVDYMKTHDIWDTDDIYTPKYGAIAEAFINADAQAIIDGKDKFPTDSINAYYSTFVAKLTPLSPAVRTNIMNSVKQAAVSGTTINLPKAVNTATAQLTPPAPKPFAAPAQAPATTQKNQTQPQQHRQNVNNNTHNQQQNVVTPRAVEGALKPTTQGNEPQGNEPQSIQQRIPNRRSIDTRQQINTDM